MELVEPIRDMKQVDGMKDYLHDKSLRDYALFVLGINSGLRVSDLISLKVGDVMETRTKAKIRLRLREQKTGKLKDFPIGEKSRAAIQEYVTTCRKGWKPDEPLFASRKGNGHLQRAQVLRILSEAAERVGIHESVGTHTLRKTFGYWRYKNTGDVTLIQKLLNHSSPAITLAYIGITRDQLDNMYTDYEL